MPMPEYRCRNADAGLKQLITGRNVDGGLTFFRHSGIFLYFSTSYSKNNTNNSSMDVQGVSPSTTSSMVVPGVSLSTASSMDMPGASLSTASSMDNGHASCIPFHRQQYVHPPFSPPAV
jgi:hypothetical protein